MNPTPLSPEPTLGENHKRAEGTRMYLISSELSQNCRAEASLQTLSLSLSVYRW